MLLLATLFNPKENISYTKVIDLIFDQYGKTKAYEHKGNCVYFIFYSDMMPLYEGGFSDRDLVLEDGFVFWFEQVREEDGQIFPLSFNGEEYEQMEHLSLDNFSNDTIIKISDNVPVDFIEGGD